MPTTVDRIRRALEKRDGIAEEEMRPLADAYKVEVQSVNKRLDEAVMLLRKGLRSEAIQRIEMTPNALDLAAELEFPEWDEWTEILQFLGIPLPQKLNLDYVAQINEAIIESLPLDALLRRHRRLAIAKAPLGVRLRTLRQIAHVDPGNSVWSEDVETWEKIRLGQIDRELNDALEREDSRELFLLNEELKSSQWRIKPSGRLVEQSQFAAESYVRQNMQQELGQIAPKLIQAFEDRDESSARALRTKWQSSRARYKIGVPSEMEAAVAPSLQWLEDIDRQAMMESERQIALQTLQSYLDGNHSAEEIQQAAANATRFGEPLPVELAQRVQELADAPAKRAKQKWMAIGIAAAAVLIIGLISSYMVYSASQRSKQRIEYVRQMENFVSGNQYAEAIDFFQSIGATAPDVTALPKMVALYSQANEAVDKENNRASRFEDLLRQANVDDPALIDELLIPQLEELAATDAERARIDDIRKRKQAYTESVATKQSDEMVEKIGQFWTTFGQLQSRGNSSTNLTSLEQLRTQVIRLSSQYPLRSETAITKQEQLRSSITSTIDQMKRQMQSESQLNEAIDTLVNARSLEVYADRLRELSRRTVADTGFVDFEKVIDEEDNWVNVDRTNDWLKQLNQRLDQGVTSGEATELMESAALLRGRVSPNPVLDAMPKFVDSMQEIRRRQRIQDETFRIFENHPLAQLVTLNAKGQQYLITKTYAEDNADRMKRSGSLGVMVVKDSTGSVRNEGFEGPLDDVDNEPMASIDWLLEQKRTRAIDLASLWEQTFIRLVSEIMTKRPDLDARIKEWMIFRLLEGATRGSERLTQAIPQTMATLQRRADNFQRWYEPRPFTSELPADVENTIKSELSIAFPRFSDPLSDFTAIGNSKLQWIGFLSRTADNQIGYHLRDPHPVGDGSIFVAVEAREGNAETALNKIGELNQGHVQLTSNPVDLIPGRPLFLFPK
ncbi:hypothetical protein LOC67_13755 [Stieleria sp. JC731]|uniref:hypothetical protein n=1 Tax=Pirellulaceae TaxID=2691357 RepID=UPI001E32349F|nr:hypothetical protein [Stieleria sp. JC731]MCC9601618.1 hypothetical protein [Stieleria sp. JC731]